jgi:hypothetical protein
MAIKLNRRGFEHAKGLITRGTVAFDQRDAWSEHQRSTRDEKEFIDAHGFAAFSGWHLGIDDDKPIATKGRYKFPYGDFQKIHRCAVLSAQSRAGQYKYLDIQDAAAQLHRMIDSLAGVPPEKTRRARSHRRLRAPAAATRRKTKR